MKTHLISYGDHFYKNQLTFLKETALDSLFFDEVRTFVPHDINSAFSTRFNTIMNSRRGGGFWIWKPYIIKKALETISSDDILFYCDAGCTINKNGKKRFLEYKDILLNSNLGCMSFELPLKEIEYTKREILDYFEVSDDIMNSNQLMATVVAIRKCSHAQLLINEWYDTLCKFPLAFTDDYNPELQFTDFISNRHDQSVFSIIRKIHGSEVIADETYYNDFIRDGQNVPIWATRLKK